MRTTPKSSTALIYMILLRECHRRGSSLTNIGPKTRNRTGRNFGQFAFVILYFFPRGHVEYLHVVQDSLFDRDWLEFLMFEYSSSLADEKRAKRQNGCHNASHARLRVLPKKDPDMVAISKTRETNRSDDYHSDGQAKKGTQTDLLRHPQLRAPKNHYRNTDNLKKLTRIIDVGCNLLMMSVTISKAVIKPVNAALSRYGTFDKHFTNLMISLSS